MKQSDPGKEFLNLIKRNQEFDIWKKQFERRTSPLEHAIIAGLGIIAFILMGVVIALS